MGQIRDRGNIKWTAMMLPEHRERLRELVVTEQNQDKPELTEEKWEEMNRWVIQAMDQHQEIILKCYQNLRIIEITGKVMKYHALNRLLVVAENDEIRFIPLDCVIDVIPVINGWE